MTRWRLLETGSRPGAWNMACDAALLAAAELPDFPPTLRLFGWDPPAVSLGHHQPDLSAGEMALLQAHGVEWVRRPTGGRAVYHGPRHEELTYSVVVPLPSVELGGTLVDSCRRIHEAIAGSLSALGADVTLAPKRPGSASAGRSSRGGATRPVRPTSRRACFDATAPWEIESGGRKLVGSAQRRSRAALLQHGSIPLAGRSSILAALWPGSLDPDRATTVSDAAGRAVGFEELAESARAAFEATLGIELEPGALAGRELAAIDARCGSPALA
jgi:lipoyl(octanoyl) transferase